MYQTPSGTRRSRRLASATPSEADADDNTGLFPAPSLLIPVTLRESLNFPAQASTRAQRKKALALDAISTITNILRGDRTSIAWLTKPNLIEVVKAFADRAIDDHKHIKDLEEDLSAAQKAAETMTTTRGQHRLKMNEYMRKHGAKIAEEEAEEKAAAAAKEAATPPATTEAVTSPKPNTPATTTSPAAAPTSVWTSFKSLFTTPFSRKRAAEEEPEDTPAPAQKRQKAIEPASAATEQPITTSAPAVDERTSPAPAPATTQRPSKTPARRERTSLAPASATFERSIKTPARSTRQRTSPSPAPDTTARSTKTAARANRERTSSAPPSDTEQATTTPAPKRKRMATTATATPLPAIAESSPRVPMTSAITPRARPLANLRAGKNGTKLPQSAQPPRRYAWEQPAPMPREPNADARIAKIREAQELRRRLAILEQDEELTRKIKRVKVDHLKEIPHNRPGDSSGTFRVPDINSDDEMEVYEDTEEQSNIFATPQPLAQQLTTPFTHPTPSAPGPPAQQAKTPSFTPQPPATQLPAAQRATSPLPAPPPVQPPETPRFNFPSVAPKPADYHVTNEYKEACGDLFAAGLEAFMA